MKYVGMRVRVEPELGEEFVGICKQKDVPAAQAIRTFMREFIQTNTVAKAQSKLRAQPLAKKSTAHGRLTNTTKRT
jgi:antitoxin component of RelBE/YafQ-DinJ toxin-antitoxin module